MADEQKPIPTLEMIHNAARAQELKQREQARENAPPPAAPVAPIGEVKPLIRLADIYGGVK